MKVLAIISSLRKKNTYNTIKQIESIHNSIDECEYEYLFLREVNLKNCRGCHLCLTKGEQFCPHKDDRDLIINKIESSDAVILASPNHTMNVNWLMKNFIDRFSYIMHRPKYFNQRFMIVITSGSYPGIKQATNALAPIVSGGKIISRLSVMISPGMNEKKKKKQDDKIITEAKKFSKILKNKFEFKSSFGYLVWFSAFKATAEMSKQYFPADYEYYKNKQFFEDTKLKIHEIFMVYFFTSLFRYLIKMGLI